jgi:hypothetical protein
MQCHVDARRRRRCRRLQQQRGDSDDSDVALQRDNGLDGGVALKLLVTCSGPVKGTAVMREEQTMPQMALTGTPAERRYIERKWWERMGAARRAQGGGVHGGARGRE